MEYVHTFRYVQLYIYTLCIALYMELYGISIGEGVKNVSTESICKKNLQRGEGGNTLIRKSQNSVLGVINGICSVFSFF